MKIYFMFEWVCLFKLQFSLPKSVFVCLFVLPMSRRNFYFSSTSSHPVFVLGNEVVATSVWDPFCHFWHMMLHSRDTLFHFSLLVLVPSHFPNNTWYGRGAYSMITPSSGVITNNRIATHLCWVTTQLLSHFYWLWFQHPLDNNPVHTNTFISIVCLFHWIFPAIDYFPPLAPLLLLLFVVFVYFRCFVVPVDNFPRQWR